MSRPPSARPKTSVGSRNRGPGMETGMARPASRAMSRSGPTGQNPAGGSTPPSRAGIGSRSGVPPRPQGERPATSMRPASGMRPSSGIRPTTGMRPPTGMMAPPMMRPPTQQGLGLRPSTRMGTAAGNRQVFDKSYYMGQLRIKAQQITEEIARLEGLVEKYERDRQQFVMYERRAEESALVVKAMHGMLMDYNAVLDRIHTNSDLADIELDTKEAARKADEMAASMEEMFAERSQKEQQIAAIEADIEEQKRINQQQLNDINQGMRDQLEELNQQSQQLRDLVNQRQNELNDLQNLKNQLETDLLNSPLKQKAATLQERLVELTAKEQELEEERAREETVEQKKEKLVEQVRKNNEEIANMEKQIEQINENIDLAHEELREFDNEVNTRNSEHMEKYKGLQYKETEMDQFFESYEEQKRLLHLEAEEMADATVKNLRRISANLTKVNLGAQVSDMDPSELDMTNKVSPDELKSLHIRLQEEIMAIDDSETKMRAEMEAFEQKTEEMKEKMNELQDFDGLQETVEKEHQTLEERRSELERIVPEVEASLRTLSDELTDIERVLENDDRITIQESLKKKLESLEQANATLRETIARRDEDTDFEQIKTEALHLQQQYNTILCNTPNRR